MMSHKVKVNNIKTLNKNCKHEWGSYKDVTVCEKCGYVKELRWIIIDTSK